MSKNGLYGQIKTIAKGMDNKFPKGREAFQIVTRISEEVGELAAEVNRMEGSGRKVEKYGEADREKLAHEIKDVMHTTIQLVEYYGVEEELRSDVKKTIEKLKSEGFVKDE